MSNGLDRMPYNGNKVIKDHGESLKQPNWDNLHKKEVIGGYSILTVGKDNYIKRVGMIRWYMGRSSLASRVYCVLNVFGTHTFAGRHGEGWAGGYGYCRQSAALGEAIKNAGYDLQANVHGCGVETAIHGVRAVFKTILTRREMNRIHFSYFGG